jgi:hypothetical protein
MPSTEPDILYLQDVNMVCSVFCYYRTSTLCNFLKLEIHSGNVLAFRKTDYGGSSNYVEGNKLGAIYAGNGILYVALTYGIGTPV